MALESIYYIRQIGSVTLLLASISFLIFQVRDGNKQLRSQGYYNMVDMSHRPMEMLANNSELADVVARAHEDPFKLSDDEWLRLQRLFFMEFNAWEYCYYQHADKALHKELWVGADAYYREILVPLAGYHRFWSEYAEAFDDPFRSYVQEQFDARINLDPAETAP